MREKIYQILSDFNFGVIDQSHALDNIMTEIDKVSMAGNGSLGGKITKAKYGKEHYQKLAENMNKKRAEKKSKCCDAFALFGNCHDESCTSPIESINK